MTTLHLVISGRVQGVGYRDWMVLEARRLGVTGWVRNVGAARVEALVQGEPRAVQALALACETGPRFSQVTNVAVAAVPPVHAREFSQVASVDDSAVGKHDPISSPE